MKVKPFPLFCMCSIYPRDRSLPCPCFLGKDHKVVMDMKALKADFLTWCVMGSGVISLKDLRDEGWGRRWWDKGGRPDHEFIRDCHREGIGVFGVVFTGQGHEIGVERDADNSGIIGFASKEGKRRVKYWGLDEFDRESKVGGLRGGFIHETACRTYRGRLARAYWVEESGFPMRSYFMCKNSPLWMEYLKRIIDLQIDVGVDGILLDETGAPLDWDILGSGFCRHCNEGFRAFLIDRYGSTFKGFNYRRFFRSKGLGLGAILNGFKDVPYGDDYREWRIKAMHDNFLDLVRYVRRASEGLKREALITGNFAQLHPGYLPMIGHADILNMELEMLIPPETNIGMYRLARALAGDKPVTAVPTIINAAHFRERDKKGLMRNLHRYYITEAMCLHSNYQIPFSTLTIDAGGPYYPRLDDIIPFQDFAARVRRLLKGEPISLINLMFSFPGYLNSFNYISLPGEHLSSFLGLDLLLDHLKIPHRVIVLGDGEYLPLNPEERIKGITVIPRATDLSPTQRRWLKEVQGLKISFDSSSRGEPYDIQYPRDLGRLYRWEPRKEHRDEFLNVIGKDVKKTIRAELPRRCLVYPYRDSRGMTIHLLNTDYDMGEDGFVGIRNSRLILSRSILRNDSPAFILHTPEGRRREIKYRKSGKELRVDIPPLEIYGLLEVKW